MSNIFISCDQWPGASENVRRSLSHIKQDSPHLLKLKAAAEAAKLKYKYPCWEPRAWAHIGFPSKKVSVICVSTHDVIRDSALSKAWEDIGWKCCIVKRQDLANSSNEELAAHLSLAVKEMGRKR